MRRDKGQTMVEYAVLVAIIVAIIIMATFPLKGALNSSMIRTADTINSAS